ncbi:MAG: CPBP family intramembrane metalloprotease [Clostridia bacterium]|nr:CPBP family intramembrane metalloprotease [Clostridia bacterium]
MHYFFNIEPPESAVKAIKRTTFAYFLFGAVWVLTCYAAEIALLIVYPALFEKTWFSLLFSTAVLYGIAFPLLCILVHRAKAEPISKRKMPLWQFSIIIPIMYALTMAGNLFGQVLSSVLNQFPIFKAENELTEILLSSDALWITFALTVIVAPIMEELVFRKMLIPRLLVLGEGIAVLISALFFGLFHGNLYQFFYAFLVGIVFGYLFAKTGKVIYTIALHMTLNFFSGFLPTLLLRSVGDLESPDLSGTSIVGLWHLLQYEICLSAIVIAGVVLLFVNLRKIRSSRTPSAFSAGVQMRHAFLCPGTICFLCFWALMFLVGIINFEFVFRGIL